jgi:antitoxin (DNA-binding transcriptional repressor) of toxin-antitoxin stability system
VDLRRRTSEVIAALDRNEELLISHRDRWVGVITPISLIQDADEPPPIKSSRYFGFARWAPRLRRNRNWPGYSTRVDSADGTGDRPGEQSGDRPGDEPTAPCPV